VTPEQEAVAQLIRRVMSHLQAIARMLETLVMLGLAVVGLLTAIALLLLPGT
jgi:hypothetical protein